ncbi:uncharacterized protein N7482_006515 [Penicillium canariense]|uniref:Uncharacterized protein n=1 Tax=Penicillium canariense TaxID=189055 RepID=A0A9W9LJQ2_9EURO|nr:uncharacterized protein N7482_006515 [Penicillium canariense]KAJ5159511.1 hypothetical protein N7482_006515 [Penicillium canariense]
MPEGEPTAVSDRLRRASISLAGAVVNFNPQPGMWAATGTAIAHAPTLAELREPVAGGKNIAFDVHGHSMRKVTHDSNGVPIFAPVQWQNASAPVTDEPSAPPATLVERASAVTTDKHDWATTAKHGCTAAWKFVSTPTGFFMTLYGLNVVAWGAMLFFVLLGAAPAMNHPSKDALNSPRKKWIEIDSQILNGLFCVTGLGLAPWRFRDLWWLIRARFWHSHYAMKRLSGQNKAWFRPPAWYGGDEEGVPRVTFTGQVAPPTSLWKLSFVVWMMVWNTLFQGALAGVMWGYNRYNRPGWTTGTFVGLGCAVALLAGLIMWWEGRKVKQIEGPKIAVVDAEKADPVGTEPSEAG